MNINKILDDRSSEENILRLLTFFNDKEQQRPRTVKFDQSNSSTEMNCA